MKRFAALVVFLACLAFPLHAQDQTVIPLALRYDLDATTMTFVKANGPFAGRGLIETSGSSTTVTAFTGNTDAFTDVVVGDAIVAGGLVRAVTAKASAISLTVDTAVDWSAGSGLDWVFYHHEVGTGEQAGVINVSGYSKRLITFQGEVLVGDGVNNMDVAWFCRPKGLGASWTQVFPSNAAAIDTTAVVTTIYEAADGLNSRKAVAIDEVHSECRFGMNWNTADDGDDLTTNREIINVYFSGYAVQN